MELKEALIFSKAEIERLKTEMIKFDIQERQHELDLDNRKIEMEKGFLDATREKHHEITKLNKESEVVVKKTKEDKLLWESQKIELTHKIKLYQRKVAEIEDHMNDVMKKYEEIHTENEQQKLQLEQMRSIYRQKLLQFMNEQSNDKTALKLGYDMNAREELLRNYNEKEIELNEKLEKEKLVNKNVRTEVRGFFFLFIYCYLKRIIY